MSLAAGRALLRGRTSLLHVVRGVPLAGRAPARNFLFGSTKQEKEKQAGTADGAATGAGEKTQAGAAPPPVDERDEQIKLLEEKMKDMQVGLRVRATCVDAGRHAFLQPAPPFLHATCRVEDRPSMSAKPLVQASVERIKKISCWYLS